MHQNRREINPVSISFALRVGEKARSGRIRRAPSPAAWQTMGPWRSGLRDRPLMGLHPRGRVGQIRELPRPDPEGLPEMLPVVERDRKGRRQWNVYLDPIAHATVVGAKGRCTFPCFVMGLSPVQNICDGCCRPISQKWGKRIHSTSMINGPSRSCQAWASRTVASVIPASTSAIMLSVPGCLRKKLCTDIVFSATCLGSA